MIFNTPVTMDQLFEFGLVTGVSDNQLTELGRDVAVEEYLKYYRAAGYQNEKYVTKKLKKDGILINVGGRITVSSGGEASVIKRWLQTGINEVAYNAATEKPSESKNEVPDVFGGAAKGTRKAPAKGSQKVATDQNSAAFDFVDLGKPKQASPVFTTRVPRPSAIPQDIIAIREAIQAYKKEIERLIERDKRLRSRKQPLPETLSFNFVAGNPVTKLDIPRQYGSVPERQPEAPATPALASDKASMAEMFAQLAAFNPTLASQFKETISAIITGAVKPEANQTPAKQPEVKKSAYEKVKEEEAKKSQTPVKQQEVKKAEVKKEKPENVTHSVDELETLVADMKSKPASPNSSKKKGTPKYYDDVPEVDKEQKQKKTSGKK